MGWLAIAAQVAGSVIGTISQAEGVQKQAAAQKETAMYQAQVARNNALIAQQNANLATATGAQKANEEGMKTRAQVGSIKAAQAAGGVDVNTGSAVDVRSSASELGQLNQLTIRSDAARQALGYEQQSQNFTSQSQLDEQAVKYAGAAGTLGQVSAITGGITSLLSGPSAGAGGGSVASAIF